MRYLKIGGVVVAVLAGMAATLWSLGLWRSVIEIESQQEEQAVASMEAERLMQQALEQRKVVGPAGRFAVAFYDCDLYRFDEANNRWLPVNLEFGQSAEDSVPMGCRSAEANVAEEYLMATICEQAAGAGGGCGRFGVFRSLDGVVWERRRSGPKGEFWLPSNNP